MERYKDIGGTSLIDLTISDYTISWVEQHVWKNATAFSLMHRYRLYYAIGLKRGKNLIALSLFLISLLFIRILLSLSISRWINRNRSTSDKNQVRIRCKFTRGKYLETERRRSRRKINQCRNVYIFSRIGDTRRYGRGYVTHPCV